MADATTYRAAKVPRSDYEDVTRRIGRRLRESLPDPETEPLPASHIQMLLELRHKERARERSGRD